MEAAAVMGLLLRDELLIEHCAILLPCLFLLMSFRFSNQLEKQEDLVSQFPQGADEALHSSVLYVWNLPQKSGTKGLGHPRPCLLPLRNAVAEGTRMPDYCSVSLQEKVRLSKYEAKIFTMAWWGPA